MNGNGSFATVEEFRALVYGHYRQQGRALPWRQTRDPYAIVVSELMLQQTRVDRVRDKYTEFLTVFPDFATLAGADLSRVLSVWQGLGYNRRAIALYRMSQVVVQRFDATLPANLNALESLPGIGPYTARAVAAFAFELPFPFVETNIRSVFIHHFFPEREEIHDREILPLVEWSLDRANPREWYYALMDLGAALKKEFGNPNRKSAHHVRQAPFLGSNRQRRSLLLKEILGTPGVTGAELARRLAADAEVLAANLQQLQREGFIREEEGRYTIC